MLTMAIVPARLPCWLRGAGTQRLCSSSALGQALPNGAPGAAAADPRGAGEEGVCTGLLVDGGGSFGPQRAKWSREDRLQAKSQGSEGGWGLSARGCGARTDLALCPTGQYVGPPTTWPQKCC